jgi:hypothetical protein
LLDLRRSAQLAAYSVNRLLVVDVCFYVISHRQVAKPSPNIYNRSEAAKQTELFLNVDERV